MPIANPTPFTLTNGTTGDATQVQANFNQLISNVNANAAVNGANSDITSLTGLTTPLGRTYGGSQFYIGGTSTGGANAQVVATTTPASFSLYTGVMVAFVSGFDNSAATTLNVGGTGVKNVFRQIASGAAACIGGEIKLNQLVVVVYDGTQWQLVNSALLPNTVLASFNALSIAAGDVIYGSGVNAVSKLGIGASNAVMRVSGGIPNWSTTLTGLTSVTSTTLNATTNLQLNGTSIPVTREFVSAQQAFSVGNDYDVAHGLGVTPRPDQCFAYLVCVNAANSGGWAVNDTSSFIQGCDSPTTSQQLSFSLRADATNITFIVGTNGIMHVNKSGFGTYQISSTQDSYWRIVVGARV